MSHSVSKGLLGAGAIIALALTVACLIISNASLTDKGSALELMGIKPPVYYPEPELVYTYPARATMLADEDAEAEEEDGTADDNEEAEEGRALSDIVEGENEQIEDYWPFPDEFQPVKAATYDDYGRVLHSAKCEINPWRTPDQYLTEDHGHYGFPQSLNCQHGPPGVGPRAKEAYKAKNWTYKCYSSGKCAIVEADDDEEPSLAAADGIAKDDQWVPMPADATGGR